MQALTARWEAMVAGIQTGDRQVDERLTAAGMELWRNSGAEVVEAVARQIDWLDADDLPAFFGYLERARKARE